MTAWSRHLGKRAEAVDVIVGSRLRAPTKETYRRWLSDLYGFLVAFEAKFAFTHSLEIRFIQKRIKSGRIATDLLALGLDAGELTRLAQRCRVPDFMHPVDGLGWLLVVERIVSQLEPLRRKLHPALGRELAVAGSFLRTYEDEARGMWEELDSMLARWIQSERDLKRLAEASGEALDCLESWMAMAESTTVHVEARSA